MSKSAQTAFEERLDAVIKAALPEIREKLLSEFPELAPVSDEVLLKVLQSGFRDAWLEAKSQGIVN